MAIRVIDHTGESFGRLTVRGLVRRHASGRAMWLCTCECGGVRVIEGKVLRSGESKSCGCIRKELHTRHGHGIKGNFSPTYESWRGMVERCSNEKQKNWRLYGGRGIRVCQRWKTFTNFLADMGERPIGKSIDRFPNKNGNYEPGNCRWATPKEQAQNRRTKAEMLAQEAAV